MSQSALTTSLTTFIIQTSCKELSLKVKDIGKYRRFNDDSSATVRIKMEVFYTFAWAPKPRPNNRPQGDRPQRKGPPKGKKGGKPPRDKAQNFSARPPKKEKAIDPDNPFAVALAGLKKG